MQELETVIPRPSVRTECTAEERRRAGAVQQTVDVSRRRGSSLRSHLNIHEGQTMWERKPIPLRSAGSRFPGGKNTATQKREKTKALWLHGWTRVRNIIDVHNSLYLVN